MKLKEGWVGGSGQLQAIAGIFEAWKKVGIRAFSGAEDEKGEEGGFFLIEEALNGAEGVRVEGRDEKDVGGMGRRR